MDSLKARKGGWILNRIGRRKEEVSKGSQMQYLKNSSHTCRSVKLIPPLFLRWMPMGTSLVLPRRSATRKNLSSILRRWKRWTLKEQKCRITFSLKQEFTTAHCQLSHCYPLSIRIMSNHWEQWKDSILKEDSSRSLRIGQFTPCGSGRLWKLWRGNLTRTCNLRGTESTSSTSYCLL